MAQIDKLQVLPRPRSAWQAMDAGFRLARAHYWTLLLLWLGVTLPILASALFLLQNYAQLAWWVWWWFKPLYELPLLVYLSHALFGETKSLHANWLGMKPHLWPLLKTYLTLYRLSPARSVTAAVVVLERLPRQQRRARVDTLTAVPTRGYMLMMVCWHAEMMLAYGLLGLIAYFIPSLITDIDWLALLTGEADEPRFFTEAITVVSAIGACLVAPFYVGGGFMLYINRRMQLEAWDIEHRFRAIQRKHKPNAGPGATTGPGPVAASALLLCCGLIVGTLALHSPSLQAQAFADGFPTQESVLEKIQQIHDEQIYAGTRITRVPQFKNDDDEQEDETDSLSLNSWIVGLLQGIADTLQWVLWIAAIIIIALLLLAVRRFIPSTLNPGKRRRPQTDMPSVAHHPLTTGLPADIPAAANASLQQKDSRAALSLLYRGAIRALMREHAIRIPSSATESDCLQLLATQASPTQSAAFTELVVHWQREAYAHDRLGEAAIASLIDRWPATFNPPIVTATAPA